jgi:hypothetical protein
MWCIIGMNDIIMCHRNSLCMLLRNFRREKTLGEMWAAVIKTINNLLWIVRLRTRAPPMGTELESVDAQKGTMKDLLARCLKKNIAQVCTLFKLCASCKEKFQLTANLTASIAGELTSLKSQWLHYWCMHKLTRNSRHPLLIFSHVQICREVCRVITGVYFSGG